MSFLRRRVQPSASTTNEPAVPQVSATDPTESDDDLSFVSPKDLETLVKLQKTRGTKRRNAWIFVLGGLFGVAVAVFFANNEKIIDFTELASVNLDSIMDVLPMAFIKDAQDLQVCSLSYIYCVMSRIPHAPVAVPWLPRSTKAYPLVE